MVILSSEYLSARVPAARSRASTPVPRWAIFPRGRAFQWSCTDQRDIARHAEPHGRILLALSSCLYRIGSRSSRSSKVTTPLQHLSLQVQKLAPPNFVRPVKLILSARHGPCRVDALMESKMGLGPL